MAKFLTVLHVEPVAGREGGRRQWKLLYPFAYDCDLLREVIVVPAGFITDFASVPRLPLVYWLMNDVGQEAAVVHDYLYRNGLYTRGICDQVFKEALEVCGVSWWRKGLMYAAVRAGGWTGYQG